MRTYVDITFAADGPSILEVARRLKDVAKLDVTSGEHDLVFDWGRSDEFNEHVARIQEALQGTRTTFRLKSMMMDEGGYVPPIVWAVPPSLLEMPPSNRLRSASASDGADLREET